MITSNLKRAKTILAGNLNGGMSDDLYWEIREFLDEMSDNCIDNCLIDGNTGKMLQFSEVEDPSNIAVYTFEKGSNMNRAKKEFERAGFIVDKVIGDKIYISGKK